MFETFFQQSKASQIIVRDMELIACNEQAIADLGYTRQQELCHAHISQISADDVALFDEKVHDTTTLFHPWNLKQANGEILPVYVQISSAGIDGKMHYHFLWFSRNVWEIFSEQNNLQTAIMRAVIDADPNLIYGKDYADGTGVYIGCNKAFAQFHQMQEQEIIGRTDIELFGSKIGQEIRDRDLQVLSRQENYQYEEWVTNPRGGDTLLQTHKSILKNSDGTMVGLLGISRDITEEYRHVIELRESEKAFKDLANTDPLTGIPNRRLFYDLANAYFEPDDTDKKPFSLVMIDVDDFKNINDTYGHLTGDQVLIYITERLKKRLREDDLLARYAGDEFAVLLPDTDINNARITAESLRQIVHDKPFQMSDGTQVPITLSIGVSQYHNENGCEALLKKADKALYIAKEGGRNRVAVFTSDSTP